MYGSPLLRAAVGSAVAGTTIRGLAFTGFSAAGYVLLAVGLLAVGLLLVRMSKPSVDPASRVRRVDRSRPLVAAAVAAMGVTLLVFSGWWRGLETWGSAHMIGLVTSRPTTARTHTAIVVIHGTHVVSAFNLTNQCTVAQILGSIMIGGAPLFLVRRMSMLRVGTALLVGALVLVTFNLLRLTAIGVAVLAWGHNGFAISHTYLGSLLTFVGTCVAGGAFALVLIAHRRLPVVKTTS